MDTRQRERIKLIGTSTISLSDAIQTALGGQEDRGRDYDLVEVRGMARGQSIGQWQVTLVPKPEP